VAAVVLRNLPCRDEDQGCLFWGLVKCFACLILTQVLGLGWTTTFAIVASFSFFDLAKENRKTA
jgi:hypothetical protein